MEWAKQVFTSFCNVLGEHPLKLHCGSCKTGILCKMHNDSPEKVLTARSQEDTLGKRYLCTCPVSVILFLNTSVCSGLCQRWKNEERIPVQWQFFYNSICKLLWETKILKRYR